MRRFSDDSWWVVVTIVAFGAMQSCGPGESPLVVPCDLKPSDCVVGTTLDQTTCKCEGGSSDGPVSSGYGGGATSSGSPEASASTGNPDNVSSPASSSGGGGMNGAGGTTGGAGMGGVGGIGGGT